jgi:hypothetical protein
VDGIVLKDTSQRLSRICNAALFAVLLQFATGFFMLAGDSQGLNAWHLVLAVVALGALHLVRLQAGAAAARLTVVMYLVGFAAVSGSFAIGVVSHIR